MKKLVILNNPPRSDANTSQVVIDGAKCRKLDDYYDELVHQFGIHINFRHNYGSIQDVLEDHEYNIGTPGVDMIISNADMLFVSEKHRVDVLAEQLMLLESVSDVWARTLGLDGYEKYPHLLRIMFVIPEECTSDIKEKICQIITRLNDGEGVFRR